MYQVGNNKQYFLNLISINNVDFYKTFSAYHKQIVPQKIKEINIDFLNKVDIESLIEHKNFSQEYFLMHSGQTFFLEDLDERLQGLLDSKNCEMIISSIDFPIDESYLIEGLKRTGKNKYIFPNAIIGKKSLYNKILAQSLLDENLSIASIILKMINSGVSFFIDSNNEFWSSMTPLNYNVLENEKGVKQISFDREWCSTEGITKFYKNNLLIGDSNVTNK